MLRRLTFAVVVLVFPALSQAIPVLDQDFSPSGDAGSRYANVNDNSLLIQTAPVTRAGTIAFVDAWVSIGYADPLFAISVTKLADPLNPFGGGTSIASPCYGPGSASVLPSSPCSFPELSGPAPDGTTGFTRAEINLAEFALQVSPGDVLRLEFFDQSGARVFGSYTNQYPSGTGWFLCNADVCRDPTGLGSPDIDYQSPDFGHWITLSDPTAPPGDANQFDAFFQIYVVPEPDALSVTALGLAIAALLQRRRGH